MITTKLLREVTGIMGPKDYDRTTQNESDGQKFYGYDDKETGTTDWYTENNSLDSSTNTPDDESNDW